MRVFNVPKHLVPIIERAVEKEIAWFNALTPDAKDLWCGPLDNEKVTVLVGIPSSNIFDARKMA